MRFLIDECLSAELVHLARRRGHGETTHVRWLGMGGWSDHALKPAILAGDWVFVTKNSVDFRGPAAAPGSKGQYAGVELHAGLVCLGGPPGMDLDMQLELFGAILDEIERAPDLVNQVLEAAFDTAGDSILLRRYALPA